MSCLKKMTIALGMCYKANYFKVLSEMLIKDFMQHHHSLKA